jgi:hypothetical protein
VTVVPGVCGLVRFAVKPALVIGATGVGATSVIGVVRTLPAPSVAATVITLGPPASVSVQFQYAVLVPDAVPPEAGDPFTVTLRMPLPPIPLSVAVPDIVIVVVLSTWFDVWLEMVSAGTVVSADVRLIVRLDVRRLPAPSVATTVNVFEPVESGTLRLQFAVLLPEAVPPVAVAPSTVTLLMPLPPLPLSLAVPASVMLDVVRVWPEVWLVTESAGALVSLLAPGRMVHTNERLVVCRLSDENTVTLNVPDDVGVPVIIPVAELSERPKGSPMWMNCSALPSGSLAERLKGLIATLTVLVWSGGWASDGIEATTSGENAPAAAPLIARTATR